MRVLARRGISVAAVLVLDVFADLEPAQRVHINVFSMTVEAMISLLVIGSRLKHCYVHVEIIQHEFDVI